MNNNDWKDAEAVQENSLLLRRNSVQALFKGYLYDKASLVHRQTTVTNKFNSMMMESQGKENGGIGGAESFRSLNKRGGPHGSKLSDDVGDENVIEDDDQ